jgi:hypothetical protein
MPVSGQRADTTVGSRARAIGAIIVMLSLPIVPSIRPADAQAPASTAPSPPTFDNLLRELDLKAKQAPAPDFVVKSRPAAGSTHYIPVGTPHPERTLKVMTPAEVAATTANLDSARTAQQRRAGLKPVPVPLKTPRTAPKSVAKTLH